MSDLVLGVVFGISIALLLIVVSYFNYRNDKW